MANQQPSVICSILNPDETNRWVQALKKQLPEHFDVMPWQPGLAPADFAVVWRPPQQLVDEQPKLKALFVAGAGVDSVLRLNLPEKLPVIRLEDTGMGAQMAEYIAYAALGHVREFDLYLASQGERLWRPRAARKPADFPVGILGFGVLAQPVSQALASFGFPVQAWVRRARESSPVKLHVGLDSLDQFLAESRILVCLLPLTEQTRHILNAQRLAQLPRGAYLINVARGALIDEEALLHALDSDRLSGAMLDVCEVEPAGPDHPFWRHPKIRLTPHIAAATQMEPAVEQIAHKIVKLSVGQAVTGVVASWGY